MLGFLQTYTSARMEGEAGEGDAEEGQSVGGSDAEDQEVVVGAPKKKSREKLEMKWTGHPWLPACVVFFAGYEISDPKHRPPFSCIAAQLNIVYGVSIKEIHRRTNACVNAHHITPIFVETYTTVCRTCTDLYNCRPHLHRPIQVSTAIVQTCTSVSRICTDLYKCRPHLYRPIQVPSNS